MSMEPRQRRQQFCSRSFNPDVFGNFVTQLRSALFG